MVVKNKILITGSSGFIGKHLTLEFLNSKYQIFAILRNKKNNKKSASILKKKYKNYHPIFINKIEQIHKKLSKLKVDFVINLATKWLYKHNFTEMIDLINSNILFTTAVLDSIPKNNLKKYINLSSYGLHKNSREYDPINLYAATKKGFIDILKHYQNEFKNTSFYNLSIYDTYGQHDKRKKIISIILKNYISRKATVLISNKVELNLLNVKDVTNAVEILLNKNIPSGNFLIKSKKFTNIMKLIKKINKKIDKKIKFKLLNKKTKKKINIKMKKLPFWKQTSAIEKDLLNYINKNN